MLLSRCHKSTLDVVNAQEGFSYYVCETCHLACDTIFINNTHKEVDNAKIQSGVFLETINLPS